MTNPQAHDLRAFMACARLCAQFGAEAAFDALLETWFNAERRDDPEYPRPERMGKAPTKACREFMDTELRWEADHA